MAPAMDMKQVELNEQEREENSIVDQYLLYQKCNICIWSLKYIRY